ncbi:MAG: hypothetical protein SGI77_01985, partial [Pirellulaceae bacterium]|nr:hypothetical protein [Pirellulaceae bacterium]
WFLQSLSFVFFMDFTAKIDCGSRKPPTVSAEEPDFLKNVVVSVTDELDVLKTKALVVDGKPFVECKFSPKAVKAQSLTGEIQLKTSDGFQSTIRCSLHREQSVEILPKKLIFTVSDSSDVSRVATSIVRIQHAAGKKELPNLSAISCQNQDGDFLETSIEKIGSGVYRVGVKWPTSLPQRSNGKLTWLLTTDLGKSIALESSFALSR